MSHTKILRVSCVRLLARLTARHNFTWPLPVKMSTHVPTGVAVGIAEIHFLIWQFTTSGKSIDVLWFGNFWLRRGCRFVLEVDLIPGLSVRVRDVLDRQTLVFQLLPHTRCGRCDVRGIAGNSGYVGISARLFDY